MTSRKDNEASASTTSTSRPNPTSLGKYPEILAYRYNGRTVYVLPAETYEQAIAFATSVFPELAHVARERISICANGHIGKQAERIVIAPMAWDVVVRKLTSFEILDIVVQPMPPKGPDAIQTVDVKNSALYDQPPKYEEKKSGDEAGPSSPRLMSSASSSSMSTWAKGLFGKRAT